MVQGQKSFEVEAQVAATRPREPTPWALVEERHASKVELHLVVEEECQDPPPAPDQSPVVKKELVLGIRLLLLLLRLILLLLLLLLLLLFLLVGYALWQAFWQLSARLSFAARSPLVQCQWCQR